MISPFSPCGSSAWISGKYRVHALDHVEQIGGGRHLDADIDRLLAVEADLGLVVFGAERDIGDVLEPHDGAVRSA